MSNIPKVIEYLAQYSIEKGTTMRSTSDLSPLEEWLLNKLHQTEQLNKPVFSVKTTDEEIWHWVEWLDKRCSFTEHQQDLIFFVIRQILKKEAGATAKGGPAEDQAPTPKAD